MFHSECQTAGQWLGRSVRLSRALREWGQRQESCGTGSSWDCGPRGSMVSKAWLSKSTNKNTSDVLRHSSPRSHCQLIFLNLNKNISNEQGGNPTCGWITAVLGLPSAVCAHRCSVKMKNPRDLLLINLFIWLISNYNNLLFIIYNNWKLPTWCQRPYWRRKWAAVHYVTWTSSFYVMMYEIRFITIWLFWSYMGWRSYYVFR